VDGVVVDLSGSRAQAASSSSGRTSVYRMPCGYLVRMCLPLRVTCSR
jgi:hypothetical protein